MTRWPLIRIHKWVAVLTGAVIAMWLGTGIVMVLPPLFGRQMQPLSPPVDVEAVQVTPVEAVAAVRAGVGQEAVIRSLTLRQLPAGPVYVAELSGREPLAVDARSGQAMTITAALAERIVREQFPVGGRVLSSGIVRAHSLDYIWGPLPAHRLVLDDDPGGTYFVAVADGTVRRVHAWGRVQAVFGMFHTLEPIRLVVAWDGVRKGLLVLLSLVGIVVAATGYYLALPRRWRR